MTDDITLPKRRRGIYLLPNLFTTAALFSGFYAIVASMNGQFEKAAVAIFVAMVMDGLDGRVARLTHTESDFGAQYDSLADVISFGLAPALIMYQWALKGMAELGWLPAKLGWLAAFIYAAATALRLARFNTQLGIADKRYFVGLACPSAAAIMAGLIWVASDVGLDGHDLLWPAFAITLGTGALMVSNILYHSFKKIDIKGRIRFMTVLVIVLAFVLASINPPLVLFIGFLCYGLSGPVMAFWRRRQRIRRREEATVPDAPDGDVDKQQDTDYN